MSFISFSDSKSNFSVSQNIFKMSSFNNNELQFFRCPECFLIPIIKLINEDNEIIIEIKCEKNHIEKIKLKEFYKKTTAINIYDALCYNNNDHNQKDKTSFIYCMECEHFFCPECHGNHIKEHNEKYCNINKFDYQCKIHNQPYLKYCLSCSKNICDKCIEHNEHDVIFINNQIDIDEYRNKINKSIFYLNCIVENFNIYIQKSNKLLEELILNFEKFKTINTYELEICINLIKLVDEYKNSKERVFNYNIIKNLEGLTFNHLNVNNIINITNKNNTLSSIFYFNKFLSNDNNMLQNSILDYNINKLKELELNKDEDYLILSGMKLFNKRIAFNYSNGKLKIYNNTLKNEFSIQLPENEYGYCITQLKDETILVGTNLGNIYSYKINDNTINQINKMQLFDNQIFKILNYEDYILISNEKCLIYTLNVNNINDMSYKNKFDLNHKISNLIFNENKLISFSNYDKIKIKIWDFNINKCNLKKEIDDIRITSIDWLEGVVNIDIAHILILGSKHLILFNISKYEIIHLINLNEEFLSLLNIGNDYILIGGDNKIVGVNINSNKIQVLESLNVFKNTNESNFISKIIDFGNGVFALGSQKGNIALLGYE